MKWISMRNKGIVPLKKIPVQTIENLRGDIINRCNTGCRLISLFGSKEKKDIKLFAILADDENNRLYISSALLSGNKSYHSITSEYSPAFMFERELFEEFGIIPVGHPWLKPVRYSHNRENISLTMDNYPFYKLDGDEIHEVAVGPIHAGVIEPGHFRFMCEGETVHHLEIQLGYQHRGIEKMLVSRDRKQAMRIAESIAGDTVIGHGWAFADAVESLAGVDISARADAIRTIALEMERAAIHIGDMAAISNDVAYLLGNAVYGATRTLVINSLLLFSGSRFGRGLLYEGGVNFDINEKTRLDLDRNLTKVMRDSELMGETLFTKASVLSRLEQTGVVSTETARSIGMVGLSARASGLSLDTRADHPHGFYVFHPVHKRIMTSGDVFARAYMRHIEIKQSLELVLELLQNMPKDESLMCNIKSLKPDALTVSMTEGWRGEIVHVAITGSSGELSRYKIKDPSFHNWFGLAQAVRSNGISDFPLCNKSFNLSYAGNDL